jgi:hypothetical protein
VIKKAHNIITKTNNKINRGERDDNSSRVDGVGVTVKLIGLGVLMVVEVLVEIGNIKVITGNGKRVVVGVSVGIAVGVEVSVGISGTTI